MRLSCLSYVVFDAVFFSEHLKNVQQGNVFDSERVGRSHIFDSHNSNLNLFLFVLQRVYRISKVVGENFLYRIMVRHLFYTRVLSDKLFSIGIVNYRTICQYDFFSISIYQTVQKVQSILNLAVYFTGSQENNLL